MQRETPRLTVTVEVATNSWQSAHNLDFHIALTVGEITGQSVDRLLQLTAAERQIVVDAGCKDPQLQSCRDAGCSVSAANRDGRIAATANCMKNEGEKDTQGVIRQWKLV